MNFGTLVGEGEREGERILDDYGASIQLIDRQTSPKIIEVYMLELPAGIARKARAHVAGVHEHVVVLSGKLLTGPEDRPSLLRPGQSVSFAADVPHTYSAGNSGARAIVTVVYPRLDSEISPDHELNWQQSKADWEAVLSLLARTAIEVQNGVGINKKTFNLPAQLSPKKAVGEIQKKISAIPRNSSIRHFVITDSTLGILSLYRTPQLQDFPLAADPRDGTVMKRCIELARLATAHPRTYDLSRLHRIVRENSSLTESALAAEILTRNGTATVPLGVGLTANSQALRDSDSSACLKLGSMSMLMKPTNSSTPPMPARQ